MHNFNSLLTFHKDTDLRPEFQVYYPRFKRYFVVLQMLFKILSLKI